jgi:hypothetical protein
MCVDFRSACLDRIWAKARQTIIVGADMGKQPWKICPVHSALPSAGDTASVSWVLGALATFRHGKLTSEWWLNVRAMIEHSS